MDKEATAAAKEVAMEAAANPWPEIAAVPFPGRAETEATTSTEAAVAEEAVAFMEVVAAEVASNTVVAGRYLAKSSLPITPDWC